MFGLFLDSIFEPSLSLCKALPAKLIRAINLALNMDSSWSSDQL
jgi:hypothetical protein